MTWCEVVRVGDYAMAFTSVKLAYYAEERKREREGQADKADDANPGRLVEDGSR